MGVVGLDSMSRLHILEMINLVLSIWNFEIYSCIMLGSKELGTNVLELHFVMLANHDQNILVLFRLAQSMCFYVKLESSYCRNLLCKFA